MWDLLLCASASASSVSAIAQTSDVSQLQSGRRETRDSVQCEKAVGRHKHKNSGAKQGLYVNKSRNQIKSSITQLDTAHCSYSQRAKRCGPAYCIRVPRDRDRDKARGLLYILGAGSR